MNPVKGTVMPQLSSPSKNRTTRKSVPPRHRIIKQPHPRICANSLKKGPPFQDETHEVVSSAQLSFLCHYSKIINKQMYNSNKKKISYFLCFTCGASGISTNSNA